MRLLEPGGSRAGGEKWLCSGHVEGKVNDEMSPQTGKGCVSFYCFYNRAPQT